MQINRTLALILLAVAVIVFGSALLTYNTGANWHDVTYHGNGGFTDDGRDVTYSNGGYADDCEFVREGFVFIGWNTEADGSGRFYDAGSVVVMDVPLTLHAQWSPSV